MSVRVRSLGRPRTSRGRRGAVRTSALSLLTIAVLFAVALVVLTKSLGPPEPGAPLSDSSGKPATAPATAPGAEGTEISGTVSIARGLAARLTSTSVLFVMARRAAGPPIAVKRIASPRFPLEYRIGRDDLMTAGSAFEGEVRVSARVAQAGTAGPPQPGDLEGEHPAPVGVGARNVDITVSRVR
jgi:cytochrome c-type biogenesis protein CcmH